MRMLFFGVGLALLAFGLVFSTLWTVPQETRTTYARIVDFGQASWWQVYEGTNYHMVYGVDFFAEANDKAAIAHSPMGNIGMLYRFFITDWQQIFLSYNNSMPHDWVVEKSNVVFHGSLGHWYSLNVGAPEGWDTGSWYVSVTVTSMKQNQFFLILGAPLLILGVVVTVYGARTKESEESL